MGASTILATMSPTPFDPIADGLLQGGIDAALGAHHRRLARRGRVPCSLRVISGNQAGLSRRWQQGVAALSAGRLRFRRRWWRAFTSCPPVEVVAVRGPVRGPSANEIFKVPGPIVQIQTPTAVLECGILNGYLQTALDLLGVADPGTGSETRA